MGRKRAEAHVIFIISALAITVLLAGPVVVHAFDKEDRSGERSRISIMMADGTAKEAGALVIAQAATPGRIWVETLDGGKQTVQLNEIWRIRPSFASDEPPGATVIDYAQSRLYVADPIKVLVEKIGVQLPLAEFTSPGGQHIYLVAAKVTEVYRATGSNYHPNAKSIIGTRDGSQQVQETQDEAMRIIETAKLLH